MPNYDAGHYFLTVMAPIRLDSVVIEGQSHSRRHLIREALAALPTVERTVVSQGVPHDAPFARTTRTHFARFVVLDDTVFNGRDPQDTLIGALRKTDLLKPRPVDRLSTPFLIFVADFDANSDAPAELHGYARALWDSMQAELVSVFQHCVGFEGVNSADAFAAYITRCQVETTMPFNDYWSTPPALKTWNYKPYLVAVGIAALLIAVAAWYKSNGWILLWIVPAIAAIAFVAYRSVMRMGQEPFPRSPPPGPASDLPTVLKALYLQREFTDLAIDVQGQDDAALYAAFGAFLNRTNPTDISAPTQRPGVIGASTGGTSL